MKSHGGGRQCQLPRAGLISKSQMKNVYEKLIVINYDISVSNAYTFLFVFTLFNIICFLLVIFVYFESRQDGKWINKGTTKAPSIVICRQMHYRVHCDWLPLSDTICTDDTTCVVFQFFRIEFDRIYRIYRICRRLFLFIFIFIFKITETYFAESTEFEED